MIILSTENINAQEFWYIPRTNEVTSIFITDEQTNVSVELTEYTINETNYGNSLEAIFNLKEAHFYTLEIKNDSVIIFRDKVFCTDNYSGTYSINRHKYTSNNTTNEYIVYE